MQHMRSTAAIALAAVLAVGACTSDTNPTAVTIPASTTYSGLLSGATVTGTMAITFPTPVASLMRRPARSGGPSFSLMPPVSINATIQILGGGTVTLTGTFDDPTLTMSGSGWTFNGTMDQGTISGTFTGPSGSGGFSALSSPSGAQANVLCGTHTGTGEDGGPDNGPFHLLIGSGVFMIITDGGGALPNGTYHGTTFDAYVEVITGTTLTLHGTMNAAHTTASGTYQLTEPGKSWGGTWTAGGCT